jgi:hypothetical protein
VQALDHGVVVVGVVVVSAGTVVVSAGTVEVVSVGVDSVAAGVEVVCTGSVEVDVEVEPVVAAGAVDAGDAGEGACFVEPLMSGRGAPPERTVGAPPRSCSRLSVSAGRPVRTAES